MAFSPNVNFISGLGDSEWLTRENNAVLTACLITEASRLAISPFSRYATLNLEGWLKPESGYAEA